MASNVRKLPLPARDQTAGAAPDDEDDNDGGDCPKCPPVGAPGWMASFADIATNLMAFFVLILGFAKFDEPSFAKMAGSMRETFGTQMIAPIMQNPSNTSVIEFDFQSGEDVEGEGAEPTDDPGKTEGDDRQGLADPATAEAERLARQKGEAAAKALLDALASGRVEVEKGESSVTVKIPEGEGQPDAAAVAEALAAISGTDVAEAPTEAPEGAEPRADAESAPGTGGEGGVARGQHRSPGFAEARLSVALRDEIGRGLVDVERRDGKVFVTVGEGGGFASGSAELTPEAQEMMARIAETAMPPGTRVTVTGHTDSVPLSGSPYVDNLGLGAARAAAVVRGLVDAGLIDPAHATATSKGETAPIADNATEEGRAKNRRIEIEIDFAAPAAP